MLRHIADLSESIAYFSSLADVMVCLTNIRIRALYELLTARASLPFLDFGAPRRGTSAITSIFFFTFMAILSYITHPKPEEGEGLVKLDFVP